jgi:hypothetical protein
MGLGSTLERLRSLTGSWELKSFLLLSQRKAVNFLWGTNMTPSMGRVGGQPLCALLPSDAARQATANG